MGQDTQSSTMRCQCGKNTAKRLDIVCLSLKSMLRATQSSSVTISGSTAMGASLSSSRTWRRLRMLPPWRLGRSSVACCGSNDRLLSLKSLHGLGYRLFAVEEMGGQFELSFIHESCL